MGDYSHLKNKKGELIAQPLPQPTLPNLSVGDEDDSFSIKTGVTQDSYYYKGDKGLPSDYPPMPAYSPYNDSAYPLPHKYGDDNESTINLAAAAAPNPYGPPQIGHYDPRDVYQGRTPQLHQRSLPMFAAPPFDDPYSGYARGPNDDVEGQRGPQYAL